MTLTQKEYGLLADLRSQEELCIEKYGRYAEDASDPALKSLFGSILTTERSHLDTISKIGQGEEVAKPAPPTAVSQKFDGSPSPCDTAAKERDAYLCKDALAMEKHVSSVYDVSIFEFSSPVLRDTLNGIQKEEQNHGKQLYEYMSVNHLYS